jgi:hypothetical protein
MRVYTEKGVTEKKPDGGEISWPADAFCEVSDERGERWIAEGLAVPATKNNVALFPPPEPEPESTPGPSMDAYVEEDEDNG